MYVKFNLFVIFTRSMYVFTVHVEHELHTTVLDTMSSLPALD